MFYSEKFMEYFLDTSFNGKVKKIDGVGKTSSAVCGDLVRFTIEVENGVITDIKNTTMGCGVSVSASNAVCSFLKGKEISSAESLSAEDIIQIIGSVPDSNKSCLERVIKAAKCAVDDYNHKKQKIKF